MTYKKVRALLVGIAFIAIGASLYQNPQIGVAEYITKYYPIVPFCLVFVIFGFVEVEHGWRGRDINMMLYSPFYVYTVATYLSVVDGAVPPVAAIVYTLLAALLTIDAIRDF